MRNEIVSIVITSYNYGSFVGQAIQSVLDQTYQALEVIVVDDGSTDNTEEVTRQFRDKITYLKQANSGVAIARNRGAELARGKYLLFLDADDYLPATFIADSLHRLAMSPEAAFVYGDKQVFGNMQYRWQSENWDSRLLLVKNYIGLSSIMRRPVFDEVGGFSTALNKKSYEDWDFWLMLAAKGYSGVYDEQLWYHYRRLDKGNRNKAGMSQKMRLRWALVWRHKHQYVSVSFLVYVPALLLRAGIAKYSLLRSARGSAD